MDSVVDETVPLVVGLIVISIILLVVLARHEAFAGPASHPRHPVRELLRSLARARNLRR